MKEKTKRSMRRGRIAHAHELRRRAVRPGRVILLGFLAVIVLGALLLHLPVSARSGQATQLLDCLFTATSATCVTGLVVVDTYQHWTVFGQTVILCLIQIGGLGIMSVAALVSFLTRRTISVRERLEMSASLSVDDIAGVVRLTRDVILFTFAAEGAGAALLALRFVPRYGLWKGLGKSVFHAVSAYCNAGFDLIGEDEAFVNLTGWAADPLVNIVLIALIVMGGLGFLVWRDLREHRRWSRLTVHTRIVLVMTAVLLVGGSVLFFLLEYSNPQTMGGMSMGERVLASVFQAVTCRTAGFNTIDQGALTGPSVMLSMLLMFIGGSPGSTAGGIKTTSAALLVLSTWSVLRGRRDITAFHRRLDSRAVLHAVTLVMAAMALIFTGTMILCAADGVTAERALYEAVSAFSTAGLSQNLTPTLGAVSKGWLILEMYLGRVGILTLSAAVFTRRVIEPKVRYPEGRIMIG